MPLPVPLPVPLPGHPCTPPLPLMLHRSLLPGYLLAASTRQKAAGDSEDDTRGSSGEQGLGHGIVGTHAYSLLRVEEVSGVRLVQVCVRLSS